MRIMRSSSSLSERMRLLLIAIISVVLVRSRGSAGSLWCVGRSDASEEELQKGLDYACQAGADCTPIQPNGLCYLPNTLQAHASYAFNSFFQRSFMAPSSCDFSHTTTLAKTDPSYGSCVYPVSRSTAGGITSSSTPTTNPKVFGSGSATPATSTVNGEAGTGTGVGVGGGVLNPNNMGPPITTTTNSKAPSNSKTPNTLLFLLLLLLLFCM